MFYIIVQILNLLDKLQQDQSRIYILDKLSLPRTRFASITNNGPILGLVSWPNISLTSIYM